MSINLEPPEIRTQRNAYHWQTVGVPGATLPHVQDVGTMNHNDAPFSGRPLWVYWVGSDGSLWRHDVNAPEQVPSPDDLRRVAVGPDRSVWCVDVRGNAWVMRTDFVWTKVTMSELVKDIDVSADKTAWLVTESGRYYVQRPWDTEPRYVGTILSFQAIAGISAPTFDEINPAGRAWGVSSNFGPNALAYSNGYWALGRRTTIKNVFDLSTSPSVLWMVKDDGTVWTTTDGQSQLRVGKLIATRVAANAVDNAYCVAPDGRAWAWGPVDNHAPPLAPPSPPPTPPAAPASQAPSISVSTTGGGLSTIFRITGSGFVSGAQVTIRGVRIGDGQAAEFYWVTSSPSGTINFDIPLPCLPGFVIHFSANDGRRNADDLTSRLWSRPAQATCPEG